MTLERLKKFSCHNFMVEAGFSCMAYIIRLVTWGATCESMCRYFFVFLHALAVIELY